MFGAWAVAAAVLGLDAQDRDAPTATAAVFGVARTADGAPWRDAEIHLRRLSATGDVRERSVEDPDRVVRTDARGRFRVRVPSAWRYACWAIDANTAPGAPVIASATTTVAARERVELRAGAPRRGLRIRFEGLDAWRDRGGFRARVIRRTAQLMTTRSVAGNDSLQVPAGPEDTIEIELDCADGTPLLPPAFVVAPPHGDACSIAIAPPRVERIDVLDHRDVAAAGAEVSLLRRGRRVPLGTVDADGFAVVQLGFAGSRVVGSDRPKFALGDHLVVAQTGHALGALERDPAGARTRTTAGGGDRTARLTRGTTWTGRLVIATHPVDRAALNVVTSAWHRQRDGGSRGFELSRRARTSADGSFTIPHAELDGHTGLQVELPPRLHARLPAAWRDGLAPNVLVPVPRATGATSALDTIDLAAFVPVRLDLTAELDALPAAGVTVEVVVLDSAYRNRLELQTDRRGRVQFLAPPSPTLGIVCCDERGWCFLWLDATRLQPNAAGIVAHAIVLRRPLAVDVELALERAEEPTRLSLWSRVHVRDVLAIARGPAAAREIDTSVAPIGWIDAPPVCARLFRARERPPLRTADGGHRFVLPTLPLGWTVRGVAWFGHERVTLSTTEPITFDGDDHTVTAELHRNP